MNDELKTAWMNNGISAAWMNNGFNIAWMNNEISKITVIIVSGCEIFNGA